ncbi:MAG TPA: hypothetical protein VM265_06080 [Sphingomicrobium sp.]|nr:hypothetical protein [Sphingomicrobium sp.]
MQKGAESAYLLEQAARCRRLAAGTTDSAARTALRSMADEYEAKANGLATSSIDGMPHPKLSQPDPS